MNWLKNKLLAGLVGKFGPLISGSISTAVGGSVAASVTFVHDKVSPFWWEWIVFVFHLLPDDIEKYLTPEIIGGGVGFAFYAVLQEWLNQRQAGGIKAIQENHNANADPDEQIAVDGVAYKAGETVKAVSSVQDSESAARPPVARRIASAGNRSQRGFVLFHVLVGLSLFSMVLLFACTPQTNSVRPTKPQPKPAVITVPAPMPDVTVTPDISLPRNLSGQWLQEYSDVHTSDYLRPAWQRLLYSIRPWGETGAAAAKVHVDENAATLSGTYRTGDKMDASKVMPSSLAAGFGGRLDY